MTIFYKFLQKYFQFLLLFGMFPSPPPPILITFQKSWGKMPNLIAPAGVHFANAAGINIFNKQEVCTCVLELGE
jgi:hypothetical protein